MQAKIKENRVTELQGAKEIPKIVDYKVTMLIAAGAAMAANCEPCLNKVGFLFTVGLMSQRFRPFFTPPTWVQVTGFQRSSWLPDAHDGPEAHFISA